MLRPVVETFLNSLTEREFDAPMLALLAAKGFSDVHFIHGAFEFGKDVIAKRADPETGIMLQYAIQSKAGNIGQGAWREIRPQLEEAEYNTLAHPHFDVQMPRVAVLLTTGRLVGAAPTDAQQFGAQVASRGLARFEVWDNATLADWISGDPSVGLSGAESEAPLLALISAIDSGSVTEPDLERYTRRWIENDGGFSSPAMIEAAVIANRLTRSRRLDLASYVALHLYRACWAPAAPQNSFAEASRAGACESALRLFFALIEDILEDITPLLDDPDGLARASLGIVGLVNYAVLCTRIIELLSLYALAAPDRPLATEATNAVVRIVSNEPGAFRLVSDQFAVGLIPVVLLLSRSDREGAVTYLRNAASWLLDRHERGSAGLGLADLDESEQTAIERLLGGALDSVTTPIRYSSYAATVVLDLCLVLGASDLYGAVRENLDHLRVVPTITAANESLARWRRGGPGVYPRPRLTYGRVTDGLPEHHSWAPGGEPLECLLLTGTCRSRHYPSVVAAILTE